MDRLRRVKITKNKQSRDQKGIEFIITWLIRSFFLIYKILKKYNYFLFCSFYNLVSFAVISDRYMVNYDEQ